MEIAGEQLESITLARGGHTSPQDGLCVMEAVAFFAGEQHSDRPQCACPVLTSFGITLNDRLPDEQRQKLKVLIPKLIGTRNPDLEQRRMWFLLDRAVRLFTPISLRSAASALRSVGLASDATNLEQKASDLEALPEINSESAAWSAAKSAKSAESAAKSAALSAKSAKSAAKSAAWSAALSAKSAAEIYDKDIEVFEQAIAIEEVR